MSEVNMTVGTPWKHIINFSFPILVGAILQQLYTTVDTIIVGNFTGQEALSAVGTTNTMVFFFLSAAIGFSAGNGVLAAQHYGAGELDKVREDASSGMVFLLCTGLLSGFGGIIFSRWLYVEFVAVPAEILDRTLVYFRIYCLGMIFQFGYNAIASVLRSLGDSAATLYFLCLASLLNILLDLLFVALLQWSVAGAAIATNISQAAAMAAAWIYMHRKYPFLRFRFSELKWQHNVVRETVRIGWPISLQMMIVALGITFIQRAVNGFGQVMTAAFTVGHRIEMYLHMPCNAMMTALATFTGQNIGAKKTDRVCRGARDGILLSFLLTVILAAAVWFSAKTAPGFFALEKQAAEYCTNYLEAIAVIVIILSLYVPLFGVFQGTRHVLVPAFTALFALTVRVTVTYLFKDSGFFGHRIIWWNGVFGFCVGCIICWVYYLSGRWQRNAAGTEQ